MIENGRIVRMDNKFAQRTSYGFNTRTHYLFWNFLTRINPYDTAVEDVVIPLSDIKDLLIAAYTQREEAKETDRKEVAGDHWGNFKEEIEACVTDLKKCTVLLPSENGVQYEGKTVNDPVTVFRDITAVNLPSGAAAYRFTIDPRMEGNLYALVRQFVSFKLLEDVAVSNKYACRLYPAFKSRAESQKAYQHISVFTQTLDEFREFLKLNGSTSDRKKRYGKTFDLKRYVVEPAIEDINRNSDLEVHVEYETKRRKLVALHFDIMLKHYDAGSGQLALDFDSGGTDRYKFVASASRQKAVAIDVRKFRLFYPKEYRSFLATAQETLKNMEGLSGNGLSHIPPVRKEEMVDGHIRNSICDFIKDEFKRMAN
jgi:hypothetical protein